MAEQDGAKPRRGRRRRSSEVDDQLAALLAKRDSLDVGKAERERIEKEALRRYAEAQVQLSGIDSEAARKVEELRRQIAEVEQKAKDDRAAGERAQAEALAALNAEPVGRTAEELARLFDLPIKRVRRLVREGKPGKSSSAGSAVATPAGESVASSSESSATAGESGSAPGGGVQSAVVSSADPSNSPGGSSASV